MRPKSRGASMVLWVVKGRRSCCGVEVWQWWWQCLRWALVTLCEEAKSINLVYEICHASPSTESEPNNQHPHHHKCIDHVRSYPSSRVLWWLLHCILQSQRLITKTESHTVSKLKFRVQYERIETSCSCGTSIYMLLLVVVQKKKVHQERQFNRVETTRYEESQVRIDTLRRLRFCKPIPKTIVNHILLLPFQLLNLNLVNDKIYFSSF